MTFADALTELATELKMEQQLFQDNTFVTTTPEIYTNLANVLKRGRKTCETEPASHETYFSLQQTIDHIVETMEELEDLVKDLAFLRQAYVTPEGAGSVAPGMADLEAARKPHAAVRKVLKELAGEVEGASKSVRRPGGAANSGQQTNEKRPYRRDLRRSG